MAAWPEEEAAEQRQVAGIDMAARLFRVVLAPGGELRRDGVPGQVGAGVMHDVEIVVEIEEAAGPPAQHDSGPPVPLRRRMVFGIGPQQGQRQARIGEQGGIGAEGHLADEHDPAENEARPEGMAQPDAAMGQVARPDPQKLRAPECGRGKRRPQDQPPGQRLAQAQEQPERAAYALPVALPDEIRLGVFERIGQDRAGMMAEMRLAVALVRHPQAERRPGESPVHPRPPRRMPMHGFVLQGPVPADDPGAGRQQQPPRQ